MSRFTQLFLTAFVSIIIVLAIPANASVMVDVDLAHRFQALESTNEAGSSNQEEPGFGNAVGNVHVYGEVADGVKGYTELFLLPTGAPTATGDNVEFNQVYVTLTSLSTQADIKIGEFEIEYGNKHLTRSDNAQVQGNPLIGNSLVDPVAVQSGIELSGSRDRIKWAFGVTNGSTSARTADGSEFAYYGKVAGDLYQGMNGAFSFYRVNQSNAAGNSTSNLFGNQASSVYEDLNDTAAPLMGSGQDITAWQIDLEKKFPNGTTISGFLGNLEEDDASSAQTRGREDWEYWNLMLHHKFTPHTYLATQYGTAEETSNAPQREYEKLQAGLGHYLTDDVLFKVEWVEQNDVGTNPATNRDEFDGFLAETSVSF